MATPPDGTGRPTHQARTAVIIGLVVVALAATIGVTALITRTTGDHEAGVPTPTTTVTTTVTPPPSSPATTPSEQPSTPATTPQQPSASAVLADFFSSSTHLDRRLRLAAARISASGPPWTTVTPDVARAVTAADLRTVARSVPAGLPDDLLRSVILVYSELSSRRHAMSSFAFAGHPPTASTEELLRELGNGHPAAARFTRDLATAKAIASETSPPRAVSSRSREAAEALLLIRYVEVANGGCDARGGAVFPQLPVITWTRFGPTSGAGTIGQTGFTAELASTGRWVVNLLAC